MASDQCASSRSRDLWEAYASENRLFEASGGRANDEQNKQQMLFLQYTWGHNLSFLFQKLCYTNIVQYTYIPTRYTMLQHWLFIDA